MFPDIDSFEFIKKSPQIRRILVWTMYKANSIALKPPNEFRLDDFVCLIHDVVPEILLWVPTIHLPWIKNSLRKLQIQVLAKLMDIVDINDINEFKGKYNHLLDYDILTPLNELLERVQEYETNRNSVEIESLLNFHKSNQNEGIGLGGVDAYEIKSSDAEMISEQEFRGNQNPENENKKS